MTTTNKGTKQSPNVLMIQCREYILYQGFLQPLKIADVKLLWLNTAREWALTLGLVGVAVNIRQSYSTNPSDDIDLWSFIVYVAGVLVYVALSLAIENRSALLVPFAAVEPDEGDASSTLAISTRPFRVLSTRPNGLFTATTASSDMASFLLDTVSTGRAHWFTRHLSIPTDLAHPAARLHRWSSVGPFFTMAATFVVLVVLVLTR